MGAWYEAMTVKPIWNSEVTQEKAYQQMQQVYSVLSKHSELMALVNCEVCISINVGLVVMILTMVCQHFCCGNFSLITLSIPILTFFFIRKT